MEVAEMSKDKNWKILNKNPSWVSEAPRKGAVAHIRLLTGHDQCQFIPWASRSPDKLDLTRFSGYKFRPSCAKGACRSSAPRARNELNPALVMTV
ncbi:hypothetical protein TNCV_3580291 [Trichonephila clavipes]|nr:hypothetical protein TNCV_3580291 [Trichonephila clavipes]